MPQVVKSPDTYPVQKTLGNAQADNIAKDNMIKIKLQKKKWLIYWDQTNHNLWDLHPGQESEDACRAMVGIHEKEQNHAT